MKYCEYLGCNKRANGILTLGGIKNYYCLKHLKKVEEACRNLVFSMNVLILNLISQIPSRIVIELNPTDEFGNPIKKRGIVLKILKN